MKKYKIVALMLLLSSLCLISCNKNSSEKEPEAQVLQSEMEQPISAQEEIEIPAPVEVKEIKPKLEPTKEDVYPDLDRIFLYKDWHPLKQTEYMKQVKERLDRQEKIYEDDSLYDDQFTLEFSLHDETRNFCIYHNIRNVEGYDIRDYEFSNYVKDGFEELAWCIIENEGVSVQWVDKTGVLVTIGTEDPRYSTKRGIKVGDSAEKIMEAYESDCIIKVKNYETNKFEVVSEKEPPCMVLSKSNECISLNKGNALAEGMMTISYLLEDGVVTKIIIQGS